jgi:hypothetical protein
MLVYMRMNTFRLRNKLSMENCISLFSQLNVDISIIGGRRVSKSWHIWKAFKGFIMSIGIRMKFV